MVLFGIPKTFAVFTIMTVAIAAPSLLVYSLQISGTYLYCIEDLIKEIKPAHSLEQELEYVPEDLVLQLKENEDQTHVRHSIKDWIQLKSNPTSNEDLKLIYSQTKEALFKGFYLDEKIVMPESLKFKDMRDYTVVSTTQTVEEEYRNANRELNYRVSANDWLMEASNCSNPVILNMADREKPGGRVDDGHRGGEEELFRISSLPRALDPRWNPDITKRIRANFESEKRDKKKELKEDLEDLEKYKYLIPDNGCIYTPHVQIFRRGEAGGYAFMKPQEIAVISVAAYPYYNHRRSLRHLKADEDEIRAQIKNILSVAAMYGHKDLVFTPFGSGIWNKYQKEVSQLFCDILTQDFENCFHNVIIATGRSREDPIFKAWEAAFPQKETPKKRKKAFFSFLPGRS